MCVSVCQCVTSVCVGVYYALAAIDTAAAMSRDSHPTNEANHELPALTPGTVVHSGCLSKLSGKGLLHSATWKRRFCVLDSKRLYYYDTKEGKRTNGQVGKTCNYVNLAQFDTCTEVKQPAESRKGSNVFVVAGSNKALFDTAGLYLSADTPHELKGWITAVTRVLDDQRRHVKKPSAKASVTSKPCARPRSNMAEDENAAASAALSLETLPVAEVLHCVTRQRTRGPSGRRLPTHATSSASSSSQSTENEKENQAEAAAAAHHRTTVKTLYTYSSSDDDSVYGDASFYGGVADAASFYDGDDTVETLCESTPPKRHSSTPMLSELTSPPPPLTNYNSTPWRRSKTPSSCQQDHRMETDLDLLGVHAAQLKSTLATLNSELRASRRDMGSLQENLATVQSAAAGVADKVVKMQSQVIAIERQVANAVKVKRRRRRHRRLL